MATTVYANWKEDTIVEGNAVFIRKIAEGLTFFSERNLEFVQNYNRRIDEENDLRKKENRQRKKDGQERLPYKKHIQPNLYKGEKWLVRFKDGFTTTRWKRVLVTESNSLEVMSEMTTYDIDEEEEFED